jgi:hypothetical protein
VSHPFAEPNLNVMESYTATDPLRLLVSITAEPNKLPPKVVKHALGYPDSTDAVRWLREKQQIKFEADSDLARATGQSRLIVIVSSAVLSQKASLAQTLRAPVSLQVSGRSKSLWFPLPMVPSLVVFDECHSIKSVNTHFWGRLRDLYELASDARPVQWCFLSATPISSKPDDIQPICHVLFKAREGTNAAISTLAHFNNRFAKLPTSSSAGEEAQTIPIKLPPTLRSFSDPW